MPAATSGGVRGVIVPAVRSLDHLAPLALGCFLRGDGALPRIAARDRPRRDGRNSAAVRCNDVTQGGRVAILALRQGLQLRRGLRIACALRVLAQMLRVLRFRAVRREQVFDQLMLGVRRRAQQTCKNRHGGRS